MKYSTAKNEIYKSNSRTILTPAWLINFSFQMNGFFNAHHGTIDDVNSEII